MYYYGSGLVNCISQDSFDIIVTNPPYIDKSSNKIEEAVKKFEPGHALYADECGLSYIKRIIISSKKSLKNNGYLFIENGYDQSQEIKNFLVKNDFKDIEVLLDYNNICRFIKCRHIDG